MCVWRSKSNQTMMCGPSFSTDTFNQKWKLQKSVICLFLIKKSTDELINWIDYTQSKGMDAQIVRYLLTAALWHCVQWLFCVLEEMAKSILCFTMNPKMKQLMKWILLGSIVPVLSLTCGKNMQYELIQDLNLKNIFSLNKSSKFSFIKWKVCQTHPYSWHISTARPKLKQ